MLPNEQIWGHVAALSYQERLGCVAIYSLLSSLLLFSRNGAPIGWSRAPFAFLVIAANFVVPALFHPDSEICSLAVLGLNTMWLTTFKVLGWAVGRGPLAQTLTFPQFVATMGLPITPVLGKPPAAAARRGNARQAEVGHATLGAASDFCLKLVVLAGVVTALQSPILPRLTRELLYALGLYLFMGVVMACVAVGSVGLLGMPVAPHFDRPFLSASLTDFWSRRWNLNTGYTMRFLVYDCVCESEFGGLALCRERGGKGINSGRFELTGSMFVPTMCRAAAGCAEEAGAAGCADASPPRRRRLRLVLRFRRHARAVHSVPPQPHFVVLAGVLHAAGSSLRVGICGQGVAQGAAAATPATAAVHPAHPGAAAVAGRRPILP